MLTITKEFVFHAAHRLYRNTLSQEQNQEIFGKCARLHGHAYRLQVSVSGPINENGMIINFSALKAIVKETIIDRYEHGHLNELEEYQQVVTTVENMLTFMFSVLQPRLKAHRLTLAALTLYETPTCWATMTADA